MEVSTIPLSYAAGVSLLRCAGAEYQRLNSRFQEVRVDDQKMILDSIGELVPAITNYTLGIELLLKTIRTQRDGSPPRGHKLLTLFEELPSEDRSYAAHRYKYWVREIEKRDAWGGVEVLLADDSRASTPLIDRASADIEYALKSHDESYVQWRYVYEIATLKSAFTANFLDLNALAYSLKETVEQIADLLEDSPNLP